MKKHDAITKLTLTTQTVRTLARKELPVIQGGTAQTSKACTEPVDAYPTPWR